jgi:molybdopterin molybdotransferase
MISIDKALELVLAQAKPHPCTRSYDLAVANGRTLGKDLVCDRDMPPFDRVAMDGIAVSKKDLLEGIQTFECAGIGAAGADQKALNSPGFCIEIMTGAPLPLNSDFVVPYELTRRVDNGFQLLEPFDVKWGSNVHYKGLDNKKGDTVARSGSKINPFTIAAAATFGNVQLEVRENYNVAMLATGDELVGIETQPSDFQIRRSNDYGVCALLSSIPEVEFSSQHVADNKKELSEKISQSLSISDLLILSGGVSKGKFDYIPEVLQELGVQKVFHGVFQRPGKPLYFGRHEKTGKLVFGLPGNPASSLINARRYVVPFINACMGRNEKNFYVTATSSLPFSKDFALLKPVQLSGNERNECAPISSNGSGDLTSLIESDGFIEVPATGRGIEQGKAYKYFSWSSIA